MSVEEQQSRQLHHYFQELKHWSRKVNLISKHASDEEIVELHFIDSLALLGLMETGAGRLLDVGSGAGFPGLVCKTVRPEIRVALVEPRLKRVSFLRHIVRQLGLKEVEVHACRLEEKELVDESLFDWLVSRAVAEVDDFLALCDRFKNYGTSVVCMKGPGYLDELKELDERERAINGCR